MLVSGSTPTSNVPVGCSTFSGAPGSGSTASSWPTASSISSAVATVTAPSTPIEVCGRSGMNVRVLMMPPARGGATSVVFGTEAALTSPSPISLPACSRSDWMRSRSASSAPSSSGDS